MSWLDVIKELDHTDFLIKDRHGLVLLFTALRFGLKAQGYHTDNFPVEMIYRHWANFESQVMFYNLTFETIFINLNFCFILDVSCTNYITKL